MSTEDAASTREPDLISVVVPLFNEAGSIESTFDSLRGVLGELSAGRFEIVMVDDGSTDGTGTIIGELSRQCPQLRVVAFTRNFGKEAAILAGLRAARGQVVIVMDGDGQHPPSLIPQLLQQWQQGRDVVVACKSSRGRESLLSRLFAWAFYSSFKLLTRMDIRDLSDFMLLDRVVVDAYCDLPEKQRFFRGLVSWMGYSSGRVPFEVPPRQGGASSWSAGALFRLASDAITSFTSKPLHAISAVAAGYAVLALVIGGVALYQNFSGSAAAGFPTVIILLLVTGALIMFGLGQIGVYIEGIYNELKSRPNYVIDHRRSSGDPEGEES